MAEPSTSRPAPPSLDAPPTPRRLAWEHELYESHGLVERFTNLVLDLWRRGGAWPVLAVVVFPFWVLAAILACGVAFVAVIVVAVLAALALGAAGYLVYAVAALLVRLVGG